MNDCIKKYAYFFVDDVIWLFRDITRQRPDSIFDQLFMKTLKEAHDKYGLKVVLNAFFRTDYFYGDDEFTLAEMTDAYKKEWEENSDWLKIGFHAKQEFPDYPHINVDYEDMKRQYKRHEAEVLRFAGEKSFAKAFNPHWLPVSKDGVRAIKDCGINLICATAGEKKEYNGDMSSLPYGHAFRLLNNRKPETALFYRDTRDEAICNSICGYNHISTAEYERTIYTAETIFDSETGIYFKHFFNSACLNHCSVDEVKIDMEKAMGHEYVCAATHEQYSYPEYLLYQPDSAEKLMTMCEIFKQNGYEYIFVEDLIK